MPKKVDDIDKILWSMKTSNNFVNEHKKLKEIVDQNELDHKHFVEITYIAHINYKKNQGFVQEIMKKIENELEKKINGYPYDSKCTIIRNLMEMVSKGYRLSSKELGKAILELILTEKNQHKYPKLLYSVASMIDSLEALELDYQSKFNELESLLAPEFLEKLPLTDLSMILAAFRLYYEKIFPVGYKIKNSLTIFEHSEKIITKAIQGTTKVNDLYWILFNYISLNTGTEDFLRNLESAIIPKLNELSEFNFKGFPYIYKVRYTSDQKYIVYKIWKPYYEELINRFPTLSARDMSTILYRMWWSSSQHGLYCDSRLIELLQSFLNDKRFILSLPENDGFDLVTNILSFLTHAAVMDDEQLLSQISDLLFKLRKGAADKLVLSATSVMSRHLNVPSYFWDIFLERFPSISQANSYEYDCYLYSIYLNVTLNNAALKETFEQIFKPILQRIIINWKRSSSNSKLNNKQSWMHRRIEDFLEKNKIKYEKEFYDDYYIDLVLPEYKLAIEVQGPTHYIFPSGNLTGKSLNKIRNLEKKGWRVLSIPFNHYRSYKIESVISGYISKGSRVKF